MGGSGHQLSVRLVWPSWCVRTKHGARGLQQPASTTTTLPWRASCLWRPRRLCSRPSVCKQSLPGCAAIPSVCHDLTLDNSFNYSLGEWREEQPIIGLNAEVLASKIACIAFAGIYNNKHLKMCC
jgi:hypothetical protein